jgi:hypothetical protein
MCGHSYHFKLSSLGHLARMIVHYVDVLWPLRQPTKANAILLIDPNAVLASTIPSQDLEPIARRHPEIARFLSRINLVKLPPGNPPQRLGTCLAGHGGVETVEDVFRSAVCKAADHIHMIARLPC